jgi:hypothetical protein
VAKEAKPAETAPAVEEVRHRSLLVAYISDIRCWQTSAPAPEPVKETETTPTEAPKEETKVEEKPAEKKAKDAKVTRRLSTRITGLFKKEVKSKEDPPAVAEEAPPKLAEVASSAPLEEPNTEVGLYLLLISAFTRFFLLVTL